MACLSARRTLQLDAVAAGSGNHVRESDWLLPVLSRCMCLQLGAEELAPEEYKAASELRARLTGALRVKQQLEAALKGLAATSVGTGPRGRQLEQLAEPVEAAIREAARYGYEWPRHQLAA